MKCDICNENEAVISLRQVTTDNKVTEIHLCMECAKKRGCLTPEMQNSDDLNAKFHPERVKAMFQEISREIAEKKNRVCPVCGEKFQTIVKERKVGCPECYAVFADEIHGVLKKLGGDGTYSGSLPKNIPNFRSVLTDRAKLQKKLAEAIEKEEYEKAALYRDQLKLLENEAVNGAE